MWKYKKIVEYFHDYVIKESRIIVTKNIETDLKLSIFSKFNLMILKIFRYITRAIKITISNILYRCLVIVIIIIYSNYDNYDNI